MSGLGPTATSGHVKQRQRQRRRLHDSHCGVMCCQVWQKNLQRPASSNAKPMAWPGLILSGFVWPDPVWCLACRIADWCVAASASSATTSARRRLRLRRWAWAASCVRLCRCVVVGPYGRGICGVCVVSVERGCVFLWRLDGRGGRMVVVFVECGCVLDGVVGGLVCVAGWARRCVETGRWSRRSQCRVSVHVPS